MEIYTLVLLSYLGNPAIRQPGPPTVRSVCQAEADRRNRADRDPRWSYVCISTTPGQEKAP